jgi:hypothetical protein
MSRNLLSVLVGLVLLAGGFCLVIVADRAGWLQRSSQLDKGCPHELSPGVCPFCDKSLVEKKGLCVEHGVPEALCTKCNPAIIVAFEAMGDWCAGHGVPESIAVGHVSD